MRRGSTPTNTFNSNLDLRGATVFVTYEQNGIVVLEKTNDDIEITETKLIINLTQEETLAFRNGNVLIQVRYVFPNGKADGSNIVETTVERILKDGVIYP